MPTPPVRFDDSLAVFVEMVASELGEQAVASGVVLRDASGRLAFFAGEPISASRAKKVSAKISKALGQYARPDRVLAGYEDIGAGAVRSDSSAVPVFVGKRSVRYIDRRLVGGDWLRSPAPPAPGPPRVVFASLKGGVGRSTALVICAAHLSARGLRVLAIDLDMEAPGIGAVLLSEKTIPPFGTIDALVEGKLSGLDDQFLTDMVGPCGLVDHKGSIDVVPAFGASSSKYPVNVLSKLSRAYAEDVREDGTVSTILDQVREMVDSFAGMGRYDVILVDARAGLHETTASAVLGLGAEVLCFALDEPPTFQGYSVLFSHLAQFIRGASVAPEWLDRITVVQGKAPLAVGDRATFDFRMRELFETSGLEPPMVGHPESVLLPAEPFQDVPWDDSLPDAEVLPSERWMRDPIAVLADPRFVHFDPSAHQDLLSEAVYKASFQGLLARVDEILSFHKVNG